MVTRNLSPMTTLKRSYHLNNPSLFTNTGYEMVVEILKRQLDTPFDLGDVIFQLNYDVPEYPETDPNVVRVPMDLTAHVNVIPKSGSKLVSQLRVEVTRIPLYRTVAETFFFSGNTPISFDDFAQYIYDRYHFTMEDGEFAAVMYDESGDAHVTLLSSDSLIDLDVNAPHGFLVVQPKSVRFEPYSYVNFSYQPIGRVIDTPLTLSALRSPNTQRIQWSLLPTGGTAPYVFSIVTPFTRVDEEGISQLAEDVVIDGATGIIDSPDQIEGNYIGEVQVIDAVGNVRYLQLYTVCTAAAVIEIIEFQVPLSSASDARFKATVNDENATSPYVISLPDDLGPDYVNAYVEDMYLEKMVRFKSYRDINESYGIACFFNLKSLEVLEFDVRAIFSTRDETVTDRVFRLKIIPQPRTKAEILADLNEEVLFNEDLPWWDTPTLLWHSFSGYNSSGSEY